MIGDKFLMFSFVVFNVYRYIFIVGLMINIKNITLMAIFNFTYVAPELLPVYEAMDSELLELDAMSELEACSFYDVDANGFRSFKIENLITIY